MGVITSGVRATAMPAPVAARVQAPGWRNPRLLIGLLLVFTAITVGARVIALADHTVPVYAARATLPTGSALDAGGLVVVRVRLSGTDAQYLDAAKPLPAGRVLLRPVGAGEVIPVAAVGVARQLRLRPVSIPISGPAPAGLAAGGLVDIWASAKAPSQSQLNQNSQNQNSQNQNSQNQVSQNQNSQSQNSQNQNSQLTGGAYLDAQRIASSVEVSGVQSQSRTLAAGSGAVLQVLLPADALPAVLNALANDARIAVLPIPGAGMGTGTGAVTSGASGSDGN